MVLTQNTHIDQGNQIEVTDINPHTKRHLIFFIEKLETLHGKKTSGAVKMDGGV